MNTIDAKCTMCGASLQVIETETIITCNYCTTTNIVQNTIDFANSDFQETSQIKRYRENLSSFVIQNSIEEILRTSSFIKDLIPNDFLANYYFSYAKQVYGEESHLFYFLKEPPQFTEDELQEVILHITNHGFINDKPAFIAFIKKYSPEDLAHYLKIHEKRVIREQDFLSYPRDAFISFSKYDYSKAKQLVENLESLGYSCWISKRNLKPGLPEHGLSAIEDAIENTEVFLWLASKHSMIDLDLANQLEYALQEGKRIIVIHLDKTPSHKLIQSSLQNGESIKNWDLSHIEDAVKRQKQIATQKHTRNIDIDNSPSKLEWTEVDLKNATQEFLSLFQYVVLNQRTNNDVIEFLYYMTGIRKITDLSPRKRKVFADLYETMSKVYKNNFDYSDAMLKRFIRYSNKRHDTKRNKLTIEQLKKLIDSMSRRFK